MAVVRRYFRGFLAIKSLLVGLAILFLWGRSYLVADVFRRGTDTQYTVVSSAAGTVVFTFGHDGKRTGLGGEWTRGRDRVPTQILHEAQLGEAPWNRVGFGFTRQFSVYPSRGQVVNIMLPHWLVFLLAVPSAVRWLRRNRPPAPEATPRSLECPRCGQLLARVPDECPICDQALLAPRLQ